MLCLSYNTDHATLVFNTHTIYSLFILEIQQQTKQYETVQMSTNSFTLKSNFERIVFGRTTKSHPFHSVLVEGGAYLQNCQNNLSFFIIAFCLAFFLSFFLFLFFSSLLLDCQQETNWFNFPFNLSQIDLFELKSHNLF